MVLCGQEGREGRELMLVGGRDIESEHADGKGGMRAGISTSARDGYKIPIEA